MARRVAVTQTFHLSMSSVSQGLSVLWVEGMTVGCGGGSPHVKLDPSGIFFLSEGQVVSGKVEVGFSELTEWVSCKGVRVFGPRRVLSWVRVLEDVLEDVKLEDASRPCQVVSRRFKRPPNPQSLGGRRTCPG